MGTNQPSLSSNYFWQHLAFSSCLVVSLPPPAHHLGRTQASPVAQTVKNLPAMQETQVPSLDQEDPLEKGMATHSSVLAWEILWTKEPGGL